MKLAIMQPYIFPYIGYFQLINAVDQFVVHDDVQWIKGGWINRNRILVQGKPHYIALPMQDGSHLLKINERAFSIDIKRQKEKILRQIEGAYRKAPCFDTVMRVVSDCFAYQEQNASAFIVNSLRICCDFLGIQTPFVLSSGLDKRNDLRGQDRIIEINLVLGASHYINPIGGIELYGEAQFAANDLRLSFIKARNIRYEQFGIGEFVPFLSIIDVMMFNTQEQIAQLLSQYDLHKSAHKRLSRENGAERNGTHFGEDSVSFDKGARCTPQR